MSKNKRRETVKTAVWRVLLLSVAFAAMWCLPAFAGEAEEAAEYTPALFATAWALLPPLVAISLALITKEVYSSLFIGIVVGGILYSGGKFEGTVMHVFSDGIVSVLSDSYNVGILVFLVLLGGMVALMNKAGGSSAFGKWAGSHIKTRVGAQLVTILLGVLIFIDDYFNCLTVGSVMRPVTDKHKISRAKLAYLIDATAAPVCIIAPISSWAAAVSGFVEGEDGFGLFLKAIPYNYYAILTIVMMVSMVLFKVEFGSMKSCEVNALAGDLFSDGQGDHKQELEEEEGIKKGRVIDLMIPIICLIICCVIGMLYTGGFFSGTDLVTAFSNSDASVGLALGSMFGIIFTILLYVVRKVLSFSDCMACIPEGFKAMVPAIMILTFAWTLKAMTDSLGAKEFVAAAMKSVAGRFDMFLPMIIFLVACFLAFATGTSWGTFGILIPIVVNVLQTRNYSLMIIAISACMAGAVCGDHCSPISDTTIMASAGAQCNHVKHVSTQLPYVVLCAGVSCLAYLAAPLIGNKWVTLLIAVIVMIGIVGVIKFTQTKKAETENA